MAVDWSTEEEVRRVARQLRKRHGALDWRVGVDDLIERNGLAQGKYDYGDSWFRRLISGVAKKVKALLSVKDNVILVAPDLHYAKEPFAKGHELGHSELSWHREILYVCDEHDLHPDTQAQMEWEANTFSSEVLF